jgi:hypothetical protein
MAPLLAIAGMVAKTVDADGPLTPLEKCCKSGGRSGNFGGAGADLRPLATLRMKIVSQCRE